VQRLGRGYLILIDYGHPAAELYSGSHAGGTLTTFSQHAMAGPEASAVTPAWLRRPGEQDITAHVDLTTVQAAAAAAGATTVGLLDQTYFLLGLLDGVDFAGGGSPAEQWKRRLALKTLVMPGGLGSTFKVLILEKGLGDAARGLAADRGELRLKGCRIACAT
jgi:SAM-dependent MidA family methyltransferase